MTQLQQLFPDPDVFDVRFAPSDSAGFERVERWVRRESDPFLLLLLQYNLPSSAHPPASTDYVRLALMREDATSSRMTFVDIPSDLLEEARAFSGVNLAKANENVFEIRRLTGLGWGQLAGMLDVDRRTVHNWVKGFDVRPRNRERIADTLTVLRRIDRGSTQENLVLLQELALDGATVLELFKQKNYEEILRGCRVCWCHSIGAYESRNDRRI